MLTMRLRLALVRLTALGAVGLAAAACGSSGSGSGSASSGSSGAVPAAVSAVVSQYGCTSCHMVPGFGGGGNTGPSLEHVGSLPSIVGVLANTPANLAKWIENPNAVRPGSGMPDFGLSAAQAQAVANYLEAHK
jgi:cytochrome c